MWNCAHAVINPILGGTLANRSSFKRRLSVKVGRLEMEAACSEALPFVDHQKSDLRDPNLTVVDASI